jgi:hypothetical protein
VSPYNGYDIGNFQLHAPRLPLPEQTECVTAAAAAVAAGSAPMAVCAVGVMQLPMLNITSQCLSASSAAKLTCMSQQGSQCTQERACRRTFPLSSPCMGRCMARPCLVGMRYIRSRHFRNVQLELHSRKAGTRSSTSWWRQAHSIAHCQNSK